MSVEMYWELKRLRDRLDELFLLENSHGEVTNKMLPHITKLDKAIDAFESKLKLELKKIHGPKSKKKKRLKKNG